MEKARDKSEAVMVFTRVPADSIDETMADPELVLATVEDMGFDQSDMLTMLSSQGGDPGALYYLMEGRWSGEETNFSFERLWDDLKAKFADDRASLGTLKMVESEGVNSQIYNEFGPVRVLSPDQVKRANQSFDAMVLAKGDSKAEEQSLEDLFDALKIFFGFASQEEDFVLVSLV